MRRGIPPGSVPPRCFDSATSRRPAAAMNYFLGTLTCSGESDLFCHALVPDQKPKKERFARVDEEVSDSMEGNETTNYKETSKMQLRKP